MDTERKPMAIPSSTAKIQPGIPATPTVSAFSEASTPHATRCFTWMPSASVDGVTPATPHTPPHYLPGMPPVLMRRTLQNVKVTLENADLWSKFHRIGTEMIITKTGRRMFPALQISVNGLDPDAEYYFLLELTPVTSEIPSAGTRAREVTSVGDCMGSSRNSLVHRLRFSGREWVVAGRGEAQAPTSSRIYVHPDSPALGSRWMKGLGRRHIQKDAQSSSPGCEQSDDPQEQTRSTRKHTISFSKVKLTNNSLDGRGHVVLTSMHKYIPLIHIVKASDYMSLSWGPEAVFSFPETEFVAVTAYQNGKITKLKIDHNPFAKGFRETGMSKSKRKLEQMLCKDGDEDIHSTDEEESSHSPCMDCNNNGGQGNRRRNRSDSVQSMLAESGVSRSPTSSPEGSNISGFPALNESTDSTHSRISYDSLSGYFPFLWASFAQQQMANYERHLPPHPLPRYNLENSISDFAHTHFLPHHHPSLMLPSMWKLPPLHPMAGNYDFLASHGTGSFPYFPHTQFPYVSSSSYQPSKLPAHLEPPYLLDLSSKHA